MVVKRCGIKKVWNPNDNDLKILRFLYDFKEGARRGSIERYCGIKTSTLYKRLNILIERNLIINEDMMWKLVNGEVKFVESLLRNDKKVWELHNPAIVVRLVDIPKWWNPMGTQMKRKLMLVKGYQFQQINFGKNNSNPYIQLKNDRFVIQMYPESIIIIFRKRYFSEVNPYDVAIDFTNDFYDLWYWFEERTKFKFFKDGVPQGILRGHDYNRINDWFGKKVVEKIGKRIKVDIGDGRYVWYDLSTPLGREANTPELQEIMEKDIKDKVLNKPMLNSELQLMVQRVTENQMMFNKNFESHVEAIKKLGTSVDSLTEQVLKLEKENKKLRKSP